jgi:hypothetical protein
MSTVVVKEIWEHFPRGGPELILLLAFADEAADDGTGVALDDAHMMRKSRLNLRAYVGALSILLMHGWIELRDQDEYRIPFLR